MQELLVLFPFMNNNKPSMNNKRAIYKFRVFDFSIFYFQNERYWLILIQNNHF